MCKPNEGVPRDTIILYVKSGNIPLAVEVPDGVGVGVGVAIGGDGLEEEFDQLNKGLEGKDFANDIFGESSPPHTMPFEPNTVQTTDTPYPTTDTPGQAMVLLQTQIQMKSELNQLQRMILQVWMVLMMSRALAMPSSMRGLI